MIHERPICIQVSINEALPPHMDNTILYNNIRNKAEYTLGGPCPNEPSVGHGRLFIGIHDLKEDIRKQDDNLI